MHKRPFPSTSTEGRRREGSTLVEVVLALGILAVAMVSLMGMLSRGVGTMRKAADMATEARIVQQLIEELQATEWDRLDAVLASASFRTRYYDDQGVEIPRGTQVYTARIFPDRSPGMPTAAFGMPGDEANRIDRRNGLRRFIVRITHVPGDRGEALLDSPESSAYYRDSFGTVVRLRKEEIASGSELP